MTFSVTDRHTGHDYFNDLLDEAQARAIAVGIAKADRCKVCVLSDDPFSPPLATFYPTQRKRNTMELKEALQQLNNGAAVRVRFEKKDGSIRVLNGTRNLDVIAAIKPLAVPTGEKQNPPDLVTIFDLEAQGWRSFRHDQFIDAESGDMPEIPGITA